MARDRGGNSNNTKIWFARIILAAALIAALLVSLIWTDTINRKMGLVRTVESEYDGNSPDEALRLGGDLNVHFVDVGQGDACIIELPDDKNMLIDAGDTHSANTNKLLDYIERNINDDDGSDIEYFDYVILTHPDSDHCGGMAKVLEKYPAKVFYRPNVYSRYKDGEVGDDFVDPATDILTETGNNKNNIKTTRAYDNAIKAAYGGRPEGTDTEVVITDPSDSDTGTIAPDMEKDAPDYYTFTFYAPVKASFKDNNDYSPVMILDYHGKRFMLSGDAEKEGEAGFVAEALKGQGKYSVFDENFTVDVFKLGHHGSRTSSSEAFIEVMTTSANRSNVIAVISCGEDNDYGHPHKEVLERLKSMGFDDKNIVRTDVNGTIAMSVRGSDNGDGTYGYQLYMGAETVRRSAATVGNDAVRLTWTEIVILGIVVVIVVLIVSPIVRDMRKSARKAARRSGSGGGGRRG